MSIYQIETYVTILVLLGTVIIAIILYSQNSMIIKYETNHRKIDHYLFNNRNITLLNEFNNYGFTLLGVSSEKTPFNTNNSISLASERLKSFGTINKSGNHYYCTLFTPFITGEVIMTSNGKLPTIKDNDCIVESINTSEIGKIIDLHTIHLQSFTVKGLVPFGSFTKETRIESAKLFHSNRIINQWRTISLVKSFLRKTLIVAAIFITIFLLFVMAMSFDIRPPAWKYGWQPIKTNDGSFTILMPQTPNEMINGNLHTYISQDTYFTYVVSITEHSGEISKNDTEYYLNEFQLGYLEKGGTLVYEKDIIYQEYRGREFRIRESDDAMPYLIEGKILLVKNRVYRIYVRYLIMSDLSDEIHDFINSFVLYKDAQ
jgi:hypothetical protein